MAIQPPNMAMASIRRDEGARNAPAKPPVCFKALANHTLHRPPRWHRLRTRNSRQNIKSTSLNNFRNTVFFKSSDYFFRQNNAFCSIFVQILAKTTLQAGPHRQEKTASFPQNHLSGLLMCHLQISLAQLNNHPHSLSPLRKIKKT